MISLPEIERLYKLGFAVHYLKPKSKVPMRAGWTKGPREDIARLKTDFSKKFNVGVRLGAASKVADAYLAVIDLDVKSDDVKHRREAEKKLFELFPEAKLAPHVLSGRGNGSAHYYVRVKEPISGNERKAQSPEYVLVKMPSVEPSAKEKANLTPEELAQGYRMRAAWEISLMSEGRQVVLPGSIHPDTGREYVWGKPVNGSGRDMPLISAVPSISGALKPSNEATQTKAPEKRHFVEVDAEELGLKRRQVAALTTGEGVEDRSAYAFGLCMALLQRGVSDEKIISLLTDKNYWLGAVGFDHAKTTDRARAALWVEKYCLRKAKEKVAESAYDSEVIEIDSEGEQKPDKKKAFLKELDYTAPNKDGEFKLRATLKNLVAILRNEVAPDMILRDSFANEDFYNVDTPWGYTKGQKRSGNSDDALQVKLWFANNYEIEPSVTLCDEAMNYIAAENEFHPVKDLIDSLEWDGKPRVEKAFYTYLHARMPRTYLRAVSRKFFLALIARIYEPGCKFDHLPVFEGSQGIGKSTFGRILVGEKWFMDGLPDLADKDAALNLQGIWLCEMSELSSLYRSQLEIAKGFIARQTDKVRPPYGARRVDLPRQSVFVGTTNSKDYLVDTTGNRRFWPVAVAQCDFKALTKDRLQLIAEAKFIYDFAREPLYLQGRAKAQAETIQDLRRLEEEGDSMGAKFFEFLELPETERSIKIDAIRLEDLFDSGPFVNFQKNRQTRMAAANVLRRAGYNRMHTREGKLWVVDTKRR